MAKQINYYEVLGISRNASQSEIRNAYRKLAKERHPDHAGGSEAEFSRLQEAHHILSDPDRRRQHDEALDLAHAADQLASLRLDFGSLDDEVTQKRREREARGGGPSLGERLRNRFRRKETEPVDRGQGRYRSPQRREARWYEPQDFDPEPVNWKTGALSFLGAFVAFIVVGQIGLWATGVVNPGVVADIGALAPFLPILYSFVGLVAAYFAYRSAGWAGIALVFVAALVVGGSGGPPRFVQFSTVGIGLLLVVIYLGTRRNRAAWRDRR
ncbi:MAG: DnaJ domain-containing protein [Actinomycetota bacterium]|nr:DnaJ domain-containing protein [Actinomycetota bacterium]